MCVCDEGVRGWYFERLKVIFYVTTALKFRKCGGDGNIVVCEETTRRRIEATIGGGGGGGGGGEHPFVRGRDESAMGRGCG